MSNPTDSTEPQPTDPPQLPADAQPTEVYPPVAPPPADAQPTAVYPPADAQPTEVYPPAGQPAYAQPAYAQPAYAQPTQAPAAYGQPAYGDPAYPGQVPAAPDARPRTLGWVSLGLAIGGLVLVGAAFIPILWVSLALALVAGLLLLIAFVLGIVTLASKKQGGKGLGIGAIAVSVLGGLAWVVAFTFALVLTGLSAADSAGGSSESAPIVVEETTPGEEATEGDGEAPAGAYDEDAFLAEVRPQITALMQELDPSITEEMIGQIYSDEMLVTTGQALLVAGDAGRSLFITSTAEGSGGLFSEEQAARFYDTIVGAAEQHLAQ